MSSLLFGCFFFFSTQRSYLLFPGQTTVALFFETLYKVFCLKSINISRQIINECPTVLQVIEVKRLPRDDYNGTETKSHNHSCDYHKT